MIMTFDPSCKARRLAYAILIIALLLSIFTPAWADPGSTSSTFSPLWPRSDSACGALSSRKGLPPDNVPHYAYRIVNTYPHDPSSFTQGLLFLDGFLYESSGLYGRSTLRKVSLTKGEIVQNTPLRDTLFGEGIAAYKDYIIQLTWKSGVAIVYNRKTFAAVKQFSYPSQGWGLTYDGWRLIMSDGTPVLRYIDPYSFDEIGRIIVSGASGPIPCLNELEFVRGEIFANIWKENQIARINPGTGDIIGWIDLSGLAPLSKSGKPYGVLNGIAYDAKKDRLFVTGKLWPNLYEIKLYRLSSQSSLQ